MQTTSLRSVGALLRHILFVPALLTISVLANSQAGVIPPIVGRWDLRVVGPNGVLPAWLEVSLSGHRTLVGRFVGFLGSVRPIGRIEFDGQVMKFSIPPQWERESADLVLEGRLDGDRLYGTLLTPAGQTYSWTGSQAPTLRRISAQAWDDSIKLFNQIDLGGWTVVGGENRWRVIDGILTNMGSGGNLVSNQKFNDFKLHVEFRYPKGANSGVYLRGRYEVQIADTPSRPEPTPLDAGSIYGFLAPVEDATRRAGEWQELDIKLIGRRVSLVYNGRTIITDQVIAGIVGGALDSDEGQPGPIMLQGDHGRVEFRRIVLVPAR
jgi:hypothetical protein